MIGGRLRPYPWREVRSVRRRALRGRRLRSVAIAATLFAALLSPVALVGLAWCWRGYRRRNDSWSSRPVVSFLVGVVITLIDFRPASWLERTTAVFAGSEPLTDAVAHLILGAVGPALIISAVASAGFCYAHEWTAHRYLDSTRPAASSRLRSARNAAALRSGGRAAGQIRFGVIVDDPVPWRTPRHGLIARLSAQQLGPGLIVGGAGTGTTVTALSVADQVVTDATVIYLDCDGSELTRSRLQAIADRHQVAYSSFDLGVGTSASRWYDPLGSLGSAEQKTAALLAALGRPVDPEAVATPAQEWLDLQHEVLDEVGLRPDESRFDFLVDTADPVRLQDRFRHYAHGTPDQQRLHDHWSVRSAALSPDGFELIRDDLMALINAAGPRLRPAHPGDEPLRLTSLKPAPGIVHVGLGAASDPELVRRVIGGLVLQDLATLTGQRRLNEAGHPDLVVIIDAAHRLGDRMALSEPLIAAGSAVGVHCWPVTRSLNALPVGTVETCLAVADPVIVHRVTDVATAERLSAHIGQVPAIAGGLRGGSLGRSWSSGADIRGLSTTPLVPDELLWSLPDHQAFVIIADGTGATGGEWWSRRVPDDEIEVDAPQCLIVPAAQILQPPPPKAAPPPTFAELVAPAGELVSAGDTRTDVPLNEAQRRRLAEYRARQTGSLRQESEWTAVPDDPDAGAGWGEWVPDDEPDGPRQIDDQRAAIIAAAGLADHGRPATDSPFGDPFGRHDGQREATRDAAEGSDRCPDSDFGDTTDPGDDLATDMSATPVLEAPPDDGTSGSALPMRRRRRTGRTTASTAVGHEPR